MTPKLKTKKMNIQEKIELYIENRLTSEEKEIFEEEIIKNPSLGKEIEKRKDLYNQIADILSYSSMFKEESDRKIITQKEEIFIEEDIIRFHKDYIANNSLQEEKLVKQLKESYNEMGIKGLRIKSIILKYAASIILVSLMSAGFLYFLNRNEKNNTDYNSSLITELFPAEKDEYLHHLKQSFHVVRNSKEQMNSNEGQINKTHDSKLELFLTLNDAVANLENSNLSSARKELEFLYPGEDSDISPAVNWYYALLCLKEGKRNEASKILKKISEEKTYYSSQADTLLNIIIKD